ncbi:MAG: MFS transporter [Alphaproteobacteria bacterium]|nr:MFS transporter [Alphaproteobacteria bacterium]
MNPDRLRHIRPIMPVLLAVMLIEVGVGALNPMIGYQLKLNQVPTQIIGIIASCYFIGYVTGCLISVRVADRVGHIRAMTTFVVILAVGVLLLTLIPQPWAWAAIRLAMGFGMAGLFVCVESWLNYKANEATRGRIFSAYLTVSHCCSMLGPVLLFFVDPSGTVLFIAVALFYASAIVPLALTQIGNPEMSDRARFGIARLFRISPLGVMVAGLGAFASTSFNQLAPVYIVETGLTPGHLATLLMTNKIGAVALQMPVGFLSDKLGRRPLMIGCASLGLTGAIGAFTLGGQSFYLLLACTMVMVAGGSPIYGQAVAHTCDHCKQNETVAASGGLLLAWSIGAMAGPTVAAAVMGQIGAAGLFAHTGAVYATIILFGLYRTLRRGAPPPMSATLGPAPEKMP